MDFSSTQRALQSLQRRQPKLPEPVLHLSSTVLETDCDMNNPLFLSSAKELLRIGSAGFSNDEKPRWEPLAVGFHMSDAYLQHAIKSIAEGADGEIYMEGPRVPIVNEDQISDTKKDVETVIDAVFDESQIVPFCKHIMSMCQFHLEHDEPRVRSLVAKVVGHHAKLGTVLSKQENPIGAIIITQSIDLYNSVLKSLYDHLASGRDTENKSKSSEGALDDTTGWRALETNLYGIGSFIQASADRYFQFTGKDCEVDHDFLKSVQYCCVDHVNRHVRAAGINVLEQMIHACTSSFQNSSSTSSKTDAMDLLMNKDSNLRNCIISVLKTTLADNWSQVRMAGSVLCRVFYVAMLDYAKICPERLETKDDWLSSTFPILLPRMCLNRFYLAQGVKLYSHETWRILFDHSAFEISGLECIAENAGPVCRYYVQMADADNHAVREAACQAIAELANKLGRSEEYAEYLAPYVLMLLQALLMCFHDESWPVRDEACLACGTFCIAYPEECEAELQVLVTRWTEQLTDQIWSVREDAAVALGDAIEAYGQPMLDKVMDILKRDLPSAKLQPEMSREEYKRRQNDIDVHTNSTLYSCGSLAPKLRKGGAGRIGCSSCDINRPKAPWEATDGCIYLIRELVVRFSNENKTGLMIADDVLVPLLTELVDTCRLKHFPQSDDLRTTLWKQVPLIAKALGKQRFKRSYLHLFLDLLMNTMENRSNSSQLSVHAAGQCAEELAALVGVGIFRGRLEEDWQRDLFDRTMEERSHMAPTGPPETFSPFGPMGAELSATGVAPGGLYSNQRRAAGANLIESL